MLARTALPLLLGALLLVGLLPPTIVGLCGGVLLVALTVAAKNKRSRPGFLWVS